MNLETIIGLEIHVQLKTASKMFCSCDNRGEDAPPNTTVCPVCMGHPGVLPVPNRRAIELAVKVALALNFRVDERSKFDRKSYFYPDLPKGYQISQYDEPIGVEGHLAVSDHGKARTIGFERVHLEEDAAKLVHSPNGRSGVDYNRAGTPLLEIVTKPDLRSPAEAKKLLQELRLIMRYLDVSDADMEKGHLRCDANISLRPAGTSEFSPKTELKNLNSFRAVERALAFEVERQTKLWDAGAPPGDQSTRGWDERKGSTVEQRTKESAQDYRYFPEPDIPPLHFANNWLKKIQQSIGELPAGRRKRLEEEFGLDANTAALIVQDPATGADFLSDIVRVFKSHLLTKGEGDATEEEVWEDQKKKASTFIVNWLLNKWAEALRESGKDLQDLPDVTSAKIAALLWMMYSRQINSTTGQIVLKEMIRTGQDPERIVQSGGLSQVGNEAELEEIIRSVINTNQKIVQDYKGGKPQSIQVLVGQVMKKTKGRADPQVARKMIEQLLQ